ncbi:leucyl/phenylalanyl-tRNA--protein transferase [Novosphingopyxis baekryungensis]|uniref:leucyl/phenylalanyl-tRNA--protein transferase n=1 Tax=Novosphingopyxis baekryungensis TaxID=279369 RepID=UPI0003B3D8BC|nr:leucyl/phenylalanyl-tRNA--protein transferase [Novosphingopyxis baekryungensis]
MPLDLDLLVMAYANGVFPMSDARDDPETFWIEPERRAILPLEGLRLSKSLRKTIRQDRFTVTSDRAFAQVIATCAAAADDRRDTWINDDIEQAFAALHRRGQAHSVECWLDGELVGGLYGMALGQAFFGESMFSRASDASKVALAWLVARLRVGGFALLDCQFMTDHLASLGAVEISQAAYLSLLMRAVPGGGRPRGDQMVAASSSAGATSSAGASSTVGDWSALDRLLAPAGDSVLTPSSASSSPGKLILQSLIQTS